MAEQLPLADPPSDLEKLVRKLKTTCSPEELRRAQRQHQHALKALTSGRYDGLSEEMREVLIGRLRAHLTALNRARQSQSASASDQR